jgi:hypothetical protein
MKVFYPILLLTLTCCNERPSVKENNFKTYSDTTLIYGVSKHEWHQKLTDAFNLPRIDQGVDSFEMRLWCSLSMTDIRTITILRYSDSTWKLTETRYWVQNMRNWNKNSKYILDSLITKNIIPGSAFSTIINSIQKFELNTLPTQDKIPGFHNGVSDGMNYQIEIATKNYYHRLSYANPFHYQDKHNKKISNFLMFCKTNLKAFIMHLTEKSPFSS